MSYLSGINATATINGTEPPVTGWSLNDSAVILRFVNSKTGKHPAKQSTIEDGTFSITVDFDPTNQPFASPLALRAGMSVTNVKLYLDGTSGSNFHSFPSAIISSIGQSVVREGKVSTTINCEADGQFQLAGGALG